MMKRHGRSLFASLLSATLAVAAIAQAPLPAPPTGSAPTVALPAGVPQPIGRRSSLVAPLRPRRYDATVNGAFKAASGLTIGPAWVEGAYRAVESPHNQPVDGLAIIGFKGTDLVRDGIRLCLATHVLIQDFELRHAATPSQGRDLPEGIALGSNGCGQAGSDVVIRDGSVSGFQMTVQEGKYRNGDGIAIEGGYDRVLLQNIRSSDNSDGCFDVKASNLTMRDLVAERCNRTYRIWSPSAVATTLTARDFNGAAIWLGHGANLHVHRFVGTGGHPGSILFRWENDATLVIDECDLSGMSPGAILTKADGHAAAISLGRGCTLPRG